MNDWQPKIEAWQGRLADWQRRFDDEFATLARKRKGWFGKLSQAELEEIAATARKSAGEDVAVELFGFLAELCDAYRAEPLPQPRAKVRAWVGAEPTTLHATWTFALQSLDLARGASAQKTLERGLAAFSIVDLRTDYSECIEVLGRFWLAAKRAGVDAKALFASTAALSNRGMGGGGNFCAQELAEFESSAYFRDHVRPQLSRASA
jgi:hypothetical protein